MGRGRVLDLEIGNSLNRDLDSYIVKEDSESLVPSKHNLEISTQKRRGKVVTIAKDFYLKSSELKKLSKELKIALSRGGSIKANSLEFQGDVKEELKKLLFERGFNFK